MNSQSFNFTKATPYATNVTSYATKATPYAKQQQPSSNKFILWVQTTNIDKLKSIQNDDRLTSVQKAIIRARITDLLRIENMRQRYRYAESRREQSQQSQQSQLSQREEIRPPPKQKKRFDIREDDFETETKNDDYFSGSDMDQYASVDSDYSTIDNYSSHNKPSNKYHSYGTEKLPYEGKSAEGDNDDPSPTAIKDFRNSSNPDDAITGEYVNNKINNRFGDAVTSSKYIKSMGNPYVVQ